MGLKSPTDFVIRTRLLGKLDSEAATINLDILSREFQRIVNIKRDTTLIENKQVNKVLYNKNKDRNQTDNKTKTPNKSEQNNSSNQRKNNSVESKTIFTCNSISSPRKYVTVQINNIEIKPQLDTASDITIISEENFRLLNIQKIDNVTQSARSPTGELPLTGKFTCNVKFLNKIADTTCYVTSLKNLNVLGLDWIQSLEMENLSISTICQTITQSVSMNTLIKSKFPNLFEKSMGLCTKSEAVLSIKPDTQPIFCAPRPVAYAVRQQVENEISQILNNNLQRMPVTHKMVKHESAKDPILKVVLNFCKRGWPRNANDLNKDL